MNPKKNIHLLLIKASLINFLSGLILVVLLFPIPFGTLFNVSFYLFILGLIALLLSTSYFLIKRKNLWLKTSGYILSLFSLIIFVLILVILVDFRILIFQGFPPQPDKDQWQKDLDYLSAEMGRVHPGLFSLIDKKLFEEEVKKTRSEIPNLSDNQIMAEFSRIVSLPNDAHTYPNIQSLTLNWHIFPLKTFIFEEGIIVVDAGRGNEELIGKKLISIGGRDIDFIFKDLSKYLSAENEYSKKERTGILVAEWLEAAGIIEDFKEGVFVFQDSNGNKTEKLLESVHYLQYFFWAMINTAEREPSPVISNDRKHNYWFEFWDEQKILYFQFNRTIISEDNPLDQFIASLDQAVNEYDFSKFIIDLRVNDGGNARIINPLSTFIIENEKINQKGKLFVLIGRRTFSGGVMFASVLRNNSKATFIGEPTGQGPIFYSGPTVITLPNSRLQFAVSTRLTQATLIEDVKPWIRPDIKILYTYRDYSKGIDPAIETVFNYNYADSGKTNIKTEIPISDLGRFKYSPYQILAINREDGYYYLSISDFNPASFCNLKTGLYALSETEFKTDIPDLSIELLPSKSNYDLAVKWGDTELRINKTLDNEILPMELVSLGKIDAAIPAILEQKNLLTQYIPKLENNLNQLGYQYLNENNLDYAIKIFKLNVRLYPNSWNVWDSLGEAYLKNGNKNLAIENYQKSIKLNPNNLNGLQVLEELVEN